MRRKREKGKIAVHNYNSYDEASYVMLEGWERLIFGCDGTCSSKQNKSRHQIMLLYKCNMGRFYTPIHNERDIDSQNHV